MKEYYHWIWTSVFIMHGQWSAFDFNIYSTEPETVKFYQVHESTGVSCKSLRLPSTMKLPLLQYLQNGK